MVEEVTNSNFALGGTALALVLVLAPVSMLELRDSAGWRVEGVEEMDAVLGGWCRSIYFESSGNAVVFMETSHRNDACSTSVRQRSLDPFVATSLLKLLRIRDRRLHMTIS